MDIALLLQMSGVINRCSSRYEAYVPNATVTYMRVANGKLCTTKCHVLVVKVRGKHKNHVCRSLWRIYEIDIEKIIHRICRHNPELGERVKAIELTAQDVDIIVRRASFKTLRLQLVPSAFYVSGNG